MLATTERLRSLSPETSALFAYEGIDRDVFLTRHYAANHPVLLQGELAHWPALAKWDASYLRAAIGDREIEFQGDRVADPRFELDKDAHTRVLRFGSYLDLIERDAGNDAYVTAYNSARNAAATAEAYC